MYFTLYLIPLFLHNTNFFIPYMPFINYLAFNSIFYFHLFEIFLCHTFPLLLNKYYLIIQLLFIFPYMIFLDCIFKVFLSTILFALLITLFIYALYMMPYYYLLFTILMLFLFLPPIFFFWLLLLINFHTTLFLLRMLLLLENLISLPFFLFSIIIFIRAKKMFYIHLLSAMF